MIRRISLLVLVVVLLIASSASARTRRWDSTVIARGAHKAQIKSTHILYRANRPGHFYGNTVRRMHYENRFFPSLREVGEGMRALVKRR